MPYYPGQNYSPYYQGQPQPVQPPVQSAPVQQMQQPSMICRPVASIEEAKAVPTDFSGATLVLTDFSHGYIYTKSLNYQNGTAVFNCFRLDNTPLQPAQTAISGDYVGRGEFEQMKAEIAEINERIGGMSNAKQDAVPARKRTANDAG
nr:MAG TPA: hypothetical protein [Caudoviricetes sp.]